MKQYLKMADGFDFDEAAIEQRLFGGCISKEEATYAAHAVVSHDELVQMNQELLATLEDVSSTLAWLAHGECRAICDGPIMPSSMAVDKARSAIAKAKGGAA